MTERYRQLKRTHMANAADEADPKSPSSGPEL
jgi:hypothetical protein